MNQRCPPIMHVDLAVDRLGDRKKIRPGIRVAGTQRSFPG
jgi:hypothetical protein